MSGQGRDYDCYVVPAYEPTVSDDWVSVPHESCTDASLEAGLSLRMKAAIWASRAAFRTFRCWIIVPDDLSAYPIDWASFK